MRCVLTNTGAKVSKSFLTAFTVGCLFLFSSVFLDLCQQMCFAPFPGSREKPANYFVPHASSAKLKAGKNTPILSC